MRYIFIILTFVLLPVSAFSQNNSSESATAGVNLITPINIVHKSDLDFGAVVKNGTQASEVEIDAITGAVTYTNCSTVGGSSTSRASFIVSGHTGSTYLISIADVGGTNQANAVTLTRDGGTETMTAELNHSKKNEAEVVISSNENDNYVYVGGKLTLGANQAVGSYQGSFTVTVAYQ